ncbi:MAG: EAL domain-containing protein [Frankiales bacterium]|nr:MAG: EAL domain-containing protein [Frankiales bacterium]
MVTPGPPGGSPPPPDFSAAFSRAASGFALLNDDLRVLSANDALCGLLGVESLVGAGLDDCAGPESFDEALRGLQRAGVVRVDVQLRADRWVHLVASRYVDGGQARTLLHVEDVTARKLEEQRLNHQANHDGLTGLANHLVLHARLEQVLSAGFPAALLFLDLDRFKLVNDSLGHAAGDQLLRQVARRISEAVRPGDLVSRLGGDEFVVLCERLGEQEACAVAGRIVSQLRPPVVLDDGVPLVAVPSIGIRMTTAGDTVAAVVRDADTAMYAAKAAGGNGCAVFTTDLRTEVVRRHLLELALRAALERDELWLAYQPIVDGLGRVGAFEALLRWTGSEDPKAAPVGLIAVAEQSDLVHDLGNWVLGRTLRDATRWAPDVSVHVNVSPRQLVPSFTARVADQLARLRVDPARVCLEITESAVGANVDELATHLADLRALGVRLAIDDFGVGAASLTYLTRLPVHDVKIDRSFVRGLPDDPGSAAIVSGVSGMAHAYGLRVVAEGVETSRQLASARSLGCAMTQGYLHAPAMPLADARRWAARSARGGHVVVPPAPRSAIAPEGHRTAG